MKFRIIEERLYNEFGENFKTIFRAKEQLSWFGITHWEYLEDLDTDRYDNFHENYYRKWEEEFLEKIEEKLNKHIEHQMKLKKLTSVKIERTVVKEVAV